MSGGGGVLQNRENPPGYGLALEHYNQYSVYFDGFEGRSE